MSVEDMVITGIGFASPLGMGKEAVWDGVVANRCGITRYGFAEETRLPIRYAGEIADFAPRDYVKSRKSLKIMSRDAQLGVVASILACRDAGVTAESVGPERLGVIQGADLICGGMEDSRATYAACMEDGQFHHERWAAGTLNANPLSFLRVLPNMIASLVSIEHDARGPNNTIHENDVSSLIAIVEACRVIDRGAADVMIVGGASSMCKPYDWVRHCLISRLSPSTNDPEEVLRPYDLHRDGQVWSEGAVSMLLEKRGHAERRGARVLGVIRGWGSVCQRTPHGADPRRAIARAIDDAVTHAGCAAKDLGHVNAQGLSTVVEDRLEAEVIADVAPRVPVTAPKSFFGNMGAASGVAELALSLMGMGEGMLPPTRNYVTPDPTCPIPVIAAGAQPECGELGLKLNWTLAGQATALVFSGPES